MNLGSHKEWHDVSGGLKTVGSCLRRSHASQYQNQQNTMLFSVFPLQILTSLETSQVVLWFFRRPRCHAMYAVLKTLLALPVIGFVSIPLIFSAWVTITFALFTLFIRLAVVYVELGYAILASVFALPTSSSSLLTFAPTEPSTPILGLSRRNSTNYALIQARRSNDGASSRTGIGVHDDLAKRNKRIYSQSMAEAHDLPSAPFTGLPISGDERRDFEGVGGWRTYFDNYRLSRPTVSHEKPLSSASSSSAASVNGEIDIDADDRAWLSLNQRLELPSQVITLGSKTTSKMNSPTDPRSGNYLQSLGPATSPRLYQTHRTGQRHHKRSRTTSSLPPPNNRTRNGLSLALSTRPDHTFSNTTSSSVARFAPFMTPQPYAQSQTRPHSRGPPLGNTSYTNGDGAGFGSFGVNAGGFGNGGGGYFALRRPASSQMLSHSIAATTSTSGRTTPGNGESNMEREASFSQLTRLMAHYPTSVRHRRRSISETAFGGKG